MHFSFLQTADSNLLLGKGDRKEDVDTSVSASSLPQVLRYDPFLYSVLRNSCISF